jgi:hypothetical protein
MTARTLCLAFLALSLSSGLWGQDALPERVLFVGNSYTYFWNLPQHVHLLAASQDINLLTRQSTSGGTHLGQHWRGEKNLRSRELIQTGDYDIVVIQDHSLRAIEYPDSLLFYGQKFNEIIRATGARPYLYMTWARSWDPYMQQEITDRYTELAEQIGAVIVPVGPAWARARELRPDLELYDPDDSHPNPTGTYLAACVFYGVLTGQSPVGLPHRLRTTDADGEPLYLNIQSPEDAQFCQKVAAEIIQRYQP